MKYTISLHNINRSDQMIVGNKASLLGSLTPVKHIHIPSGFVIPAYIFNATLAINGIYSSLFRRINETDFNDKKDVKHMSRFAIRKIRNMRIPEYMLAEIILASQRMPHNVFAVRSSAIVEDRTGLSWAGQFETVLGTTTATLGYDIKKVWASMFSYRALSYRVIHKRIYEPYSMAVIVQVMIPAHASGVGFSKHPNNGFENTHTIEAVLGIGNTLAFGKENPDVYLIENKKHICIDASISVQKRKSVLIGNKLILKRINKKQGTQMSLFKKDVELLSRHMSFLEKRFGMPVNIEWAKYKNKILLLQVRHITHKVPSQDTHTHKLIWYKPVQAFVVTEIWAASELRVKKLLGISTVSDPIFVHNANSGIEVHYHKNDIRNKPMVLLNLYENNPSLFTTTLQQYQKLIKTMLSDNFTKLSTAEIFNILGQVWPFMTVLYILLGLRDRGVLLPKWLEKKAVSARLTGEKVSHDVISRILAKNETLLGGPTDGYYYADFLTGDEIITDTPVSTSTLRRRGKDTFVYYKNEIYTGKRALKLIRDKIFIANLSGNKNIEKISGKRIYPGKIFGHAYVSSEHADIANIPNQYILISRNLSPESIAVLPNNIKGIIIEDGGEFSHGAILARELGIPCVVGVANITKMIKTGEMISVEAHSGALKLK